jgi:hypothetical protein
MLNTLKNIDAMLDHLLKVFCEQIKKTSTKMKHLGGLV